MRGRTTGEEQRSMERCSRRGDGPTRPGISQKKKKNSTLGLSNTTQK